MCIIYNSLSSRLETIVDLLGARENLPGQTFNLVNKHCASCVFASAPTIELQSQEEEEAHLLHLDRDQRDVDDELAPVAADQIRAQ